MGVPRGCRAGLAAERAWGHSGARHLRPSREGISTARDARITTITTSATDLGQLSQITTRDDSQEKCASDWEDLRILGSRTRDRGMRRARAARAPRVGFAVVATTHIANLLALRFAPRARMGRSGPRLLSLDAGVTGAARRAVDASDGSASTACFASMWHPPLRRSGGVLRGNVI